MKKNTTQFAAFVGLDWADQKHDVSISGNQEDSPVHQVIDHTPEALNEWLTNLRLQFPEGQIALCLEQSKGPVIFHLLGYDFITLFPINPKSLARFREAFTSSGAKGDSTDAEFLRQVVAGYHNQLRPWTPDNEHTRTIAFLVEGRRKTINDRTRMTNRLRATLKMYYPQAIDLAGVSLFKTMALDFLRQWPQLCDIQRAKKKTIQTFYSTHNSRSTKRLKERLELISSALPITADQAVIKSCLLQVELLIGQIALLNDAIEKFDTELKTLYDAHPDKEIFESFPGAGDALGPRLLSAWGADRSRHDSANSMQNYSGIAPITKASGKSKVVIRRVASPKFLQQTFHEFANCSRRSSAWAQAYYEMVRKHGKSHHMALRSLAFKWIRIMFHCWQNRLRYDETKYIQALKRSNSPLLNFI